MRVAWAVVIAVCFFVAGWGMAIHRVAPAAKAAKQIIEENQQLRYENEQLRHEISQKFV